MNHRGTISQKWLLAIAATAHEANRQFCVALGDLSQPTWSDAPEWQKDSAVNGVIAVLEGRVVRPSDSHVSWSHQKLQDGWKYGPVKDPEKKEHPCLVPFEELPRDQQTKDHLFFAVVNTLIDRV